MDPVSIGIGLASLGSGILGGRSARKSAKKAAREQAMLVGQQRNEEIRQARRQASFEGGAARALIGASNVQFSGSMERYARELDIENMREIAFMERAKKQEQRAIKAGASGAGDAMLYRGVSDAISYGIQGLFRDSGSSSGGST
jgi:hypothetical protein